jgi:drug/metabolite transporter (DMT)-like permease
VVTAGRLWIGAAFLIAWCARCGERLPPLLPRPDPLWRWLIALGLFGNAAPFFLITLGQTRVDSGLAAILTSTMPLMTAGLAHAFVPGEHLTWRRAGGLALGFAGVALLVGPAALADLGGASTLAQFAVLGGALCYAINAVVARRAPGASPRVVAAGMVFTAAVMMTPFALIHAAGPTPNPGAIAAILALGLGSTGVAAVVYMHLIRSAGPSFLAQTNFLTPVTAVAVGWLIGERPGPAAFAALGLIFAGLALGARRVRFESAPGSTPPPRRRS